MEIPQSAEGVSKLLRSKNITTHQIYEIVSEIFDSNTDIYFPNKEVFVLELIVDRWNDQKQLEFKLDYRIWELFNRMWKLLASDSHRKKIFKNLKFVPHLIQTLSSIENDTDLYINVFLETITLLNSCLTVEVSTENENKIIGSTLRLLLKSGVVELQFRNRLIREVTTFTNFTRNRETNPKIATAFVMELFLPTLQYITLFPSDEHDESTKTLTAYIGRFLFSEQIDCTKQLEKFISAYGQELSVETITTLFRTCIQFLSRSDFTQLEKIFTLLVKVQPSVAPVLLSDLSISKKTMSQQFLENLFNEAHSALTTSDNEGAWSLIGNILELDIEVGILNTKVLMDSLAKENITPQVVRTWSKLVQCHINAREYMQFLAIWKDYSEDEQKSNCFLTEPSFFKVISENVPSLSTTQLRQLLSELVDEIILDITQITTIHVLTVILSGFHKLSYMILPEFKLILSKIFEVEGHSSEFWNLKYHILEIYDDVIPEEQLAQIDGSFVKNAIKNKQVSSDFFFSIFKLRELKEFDLSTTVHEFSKFVTTLSPTETTDVIKQLFQRWSSLVNLTFDKESLQKLVNILLQDSNIGLLEILFKDDDFFEESNILYFLVEKMSTMHENGLAMKYFTQIPIQCINKSVRVETINRITEKRHLGDQEVSVLCHLLSNPTFKSNIETDFNRLANVICQDSNTYLFENRLFETIWNNHLSQLKETNSLNFVEGFISKLSQGMEKEFELNNFQMAFYAIKGNTALHQGLSTLRDQFISHAIHKLSKSKDVFQETRLFSWLLRSLYYVCQKKSSAKDERLSKLVNELAKHLKKTTSLDKQLFTSFFLLYSIVYQDKLEYLLAHYVVLRQMGIPSDDISPGVISVIEKSLEDGFHGFNNAFDTVIQSFSQLSGGVTDSILELYIHFSVRLTKDNEVGTKLFVRSVSEFYTNCDSFIGKKDSILTVINCYKSLLITKNWLFPQFCMESLFPLSLKLNIASVCQKHENNDDIFVATTQLLSSILLFHRYRLSNRHHLINTSLCTLLGLISENSKYGLTHTSARSLARLINNFCEPSNISNNNSTKSSLTSKVSAIKRPLRKYLPVLLLKYIHLAINSPFEIAVKQELVIGIYSIFDVLSQDELLIVNASLDNPGRTYYRTLYTEYKKRGKWHDD